jgi:hypothetical protein
VAATRLFYATSHRPLDGHPETAGRNSTLADIFHEVDEEVRREQLKKLWERYGAYAIAVAVLIVIIIGGWRAYQYWQMQKAFEAGAKFEAAAQLAEEGKTQDAQVAFQKLATDGTAGYRLLARLREAALVGERDLKAGAAAYDAIAADSSAGRRLQDLASLRAALLLVDSASYDEIRRRLEPQTSQSATFRHSARELLALSAWKNGDMKAARQWSQAITSDPETPASIRGRVEMLMALIGETGAG